MLCLVQHFSQSCNKQYFLSVFYFSPPSWCIVSDLGSGVCVTVGYKAHDKPKVIAIPNPIIYICPPQCEIVSVEAKHT